MVKEQFVGEHYQDIGELNREVRAEYRKLNGDLRGKDILSVEQFDGETIARVLERADEIEVMTREERHGVLRGKHVTVVFYQPSTRTFTSFMRAAQELGAEVMGLQGMDQFSSVAKGESLEDTTWALEAYETDLIVLRHFADNSALIAADETDIPVISGGAGKYEHPTQALLDLRTLVKESPLEDPRKMHVGFVGDLKYGRTVHSLSRLLAITGVGQISFISPESLKLPRPILTALQNDGVRVVEVENLAEIIGQVDALYVTRIQEEWFAPEEYEACMAMAKSYWITPEVMQLMKPEAIVLHPLPRKEEISKAVDRDPRAVYRRQMNHGLYVRMALLSLILES